MNEPIHLKVCPACHTGIPEESVTCPECGARQAAGSGAPPDDLEELLGAFGAFFGEAPGGPPRRAATGTLLKHALRQRLGCVIQAAVLLFGLPLLIGALAGDTLGGLAVMLLVVASVGLILTAVLVWLVWPRRRS